MKLSPLLAAAIVTSFGVLAGLELLIRHSAGFQRAIYENSRPLMSDHFRFSYRLGQAQKDHSPLKIGFLGTSTARDGIDVGLLETKIPSVRFYNLGSSFMAPLFELAHVEALKAAKFNILVYPISSTDVLKFSEEHALLLYANAPAFKQILRQNSIKYLFENRSLLLWGALSGWSDLFKFRDAILDSMHNFVLRRLLHRPFDFETHYWKQQPELSLSSTLVQFQFGYAWQSSAYFDKKLAETRTQLKELGRLLQQENIKLMFYEMPGYCQSYETYVTNRAKRAAQNFSEQLMELSRENSSIFHVKSGPLPADECAETFHVNDKGRARIAAELTPVIQSLLDKGRL